MNTAAISVTGNTFAFDRASVRRKDADGLLHVSMTPVSKANICIYYGREIPEAEAMGLDANKAYRLLRCPDELAKAAPSFNNKPVLNRHLPVLAANPPKDAIIGSTGEGSNFDGTYLQNSLVVWDDPAIAGIESDQQREISSSYRYRADMTPGVYNGEEYDGVMRDIICNHVAIVPDGRAGPDVLVYDSKPLGYDLMSKLEKFWSKLAPKLAADADPEEVKKDLKDMVEDEDEKKEEKPLASDDSDSDESEEKKDEKPMASDSKPGSTVTLKLDPTDTKLAMDALETRLRSQFRDLREAEQMCEPMIGRVACDSAEEVYRMALAQAGVDATGVHASALKPMVQLLSKRPAMANDSAPSFTRDDDEAARNLIFGGKK